MEVEPVVGPDGVTAGQPVNQTEEEEEQETVQPLVLPEIPAYKK